MLEFKTLTGEIKDIDIKKRIVTGYLSAFNNLDFVGDIIEPGAFTKTLKERKSQIYFLDNHNWAQPHGKFTTLVEDKKGLYFESEPLVDTTYSSDLLKLYEAGIVKEHSIGFQTVKSDEKKDVRYLRELKLFEGSNVTMGANPDTPFMGFKNLTLKEINKKADIIVKAIRRGDFTDDTFLLLEFALKQLQQDAYNLGKSLDTKEPHSTLDTLKPTLDIINEFRKQLNG